MNVRPEQLESSLNKRLDALYVLVGDDWLQVDEARDAIRVATRRAGVEERIRVEAEARYDWNALQHLGASRSLFAERRLIDLRLPTGKPGKEGGEFLRKLADQVAEGSDDIWMISLPKLDLATQKTAWFSRLSAAGMTITFWPIGLRDLPGWIAQRGRKLGLQVDADAAQLIAERVEGNLLAARQELDKLALLQPEGVITPDYLMETVADQSRFNTFDLGDALLAGDRGRAVHLLQRLRVEGVDAILVLWVLTRELRLLISCSEDPAAIERLRVPRNRQPAYARAARRRGPDFWMRLLGRCAEIDRSIKGVGPGDPWQMLDRVVLAGCVASPAR